MVAVGMLSLSYVLSDGKKSLSASICCAGPQKSSIFDPGLFGSGIRFDFTCSHHRAIAVENKHIVTYIGHHELENKKIMPWFVGD